MIAAEQKARVTYDNLLRLIDDPDVCDPIKFLREREVVHYQRFGEAKLLIYTDFNPSKPQNQLIRNLNSTGLNFAILGYPTVVPEGTSLYVPLSVFTSITKDSIL